MEKLHSETRVIVDLCSFEMSASATAKMSAKGPKRVEIDVRQNATSSLNEAAEMGGGANVSDGAGRGISVAFDVICERVDVWSTIPGRKRCSVLGAEKYLSNMGSSC
jgi:hypothetical protein